MLGLSVHGTSSGAWHTDSFFVTQIPQMTQIFFRRTRIARITRIIRQHRKTRKTRIIYSWRVERGRWILYFVVLKEEGLLLGEVGFVPMGDEVCGLLLEGWVACAQVKESQELGLATLFVITYHIKQTLGDLYTFFLHGVFDAGIELPAQEYVDKVGHFYRRQETA